jgi:hypothetical protein
MFGTISPGKTKPGFHTNINFGDSQAPICPGNDTESKKFEIYTECKNSGVFAQHKISFCSIRDLESAN